MIVIAGQLLPFGRWPGEGEGGQGRAPAFIFVFLLFGCKATSHRIASNCFSFSSFSSLSPLSPLSPLSLSLLPPHFQLMAIRVQRSELM